MFPFLNGICDGSTITALRCFYSPGSEVIKFKDYPCDTIFGNTSVEDNKSINFKSNIYPNPFNPTTTITFRLTKSIQVKLSVYNNQGKLIKALVDAPKKTGSYNVEWNAWAQPSGIYLFKLNAGDYNAIKRGILIK
jgi:hypothetical protein